MHFFLCGYNNTPNIFFIRMQNPPKKKNTDFTKLNVRGETPEVTVKASAVIYGKDLYVFGGEKTDSNYTNQTYKYSFGLSIIIFFWKNDKLIICCICFFAYFWIVTETWEEIPIIGYAPSPRASHCAVVYQKEMYIFGGRDNENSFNDIHAFSFGLKIVNWYICISFFFLFFFFVLR